MLLDDLSPAGAQVVGFLMGVSMLVVSVALGMLAGKQFSERRTRILVGWTVGVATMLLLQLFAEPVRERLRHARCQSLSGEDYVSCVEEGSVDEYDQGEFGLF